MLLLKAKKPDKEGLSNPFKLPRGERLRREVVGVFRSQRQAIIRFAQTGKKNDSKSGGGAGVSFLRDLHPHSDLARKDQEAPRGLPFAWPDWHDFGLGALDISQRMTPLLTLTWEAAAAKFAPRVGLDPDSWDVVNPHTERMIADAALAFCDSTNETTSLALDEALEKTRAELHEGIVRQGESLEKLTKRVNRIFDGAERWRARRIAWTETSRAVHAAQEQAAIASGVVTGWRWLLSGDACPICFAIAARCPAVRLGQAFAVIGDDPHYSQIKFPPCHPHCNCSMLEVLDTDDQPRWRDTLHQPGPATEDEHEAVARETQERDERTIAGSVAWGAESGPAGPERPRPPAARKPRPAAKPRPAPPKKPEKPAWQWGEPIDPDRPIAERIKASPAWGRAQELAKANEEYVSYRDAARAMNEAYDKLQSEAQAGLAAGSLTEAEKARFLAELKRTEDQYKLARRMRDAAKAAAADETARILALPPKARAYAWDIDRSGVNADNKSAVANAERFVAGLVAAPKGDAYAAAGRGNPRTNPRLVGDKLAWKVIPAGKEQRAHCKDWLNEVWLSQQDSSSTAVHEWGHQIERSVPGVREATDEFLKHRVGPEPLRKLNDIFPGKRYKDDEEGREDDFGKAFGEHRWYVGKHYAGASEIISMGLEKLYSDPGGFAKADPEYCAFILGILDGSLRKP